MKPRRRRKCPSCGQLYEPDPRNLRHQRYCRQPACRQASKVASQRRWRQSPKGRDYFKGTANVIRVQAWRRAHPGYWRGRPKPSRALQDHSLAQPFVVKADTFRLTHRALQDQLLMQTSLLLGLIANLTGSALQEDIDATSRRLIGLGRQLQAGARQGASDAHQTPPLSATLAPGAPAVQLDRSPPGPG